MKRYLELLQVLDLLGKRLLDFPQLFLLPFTPCGQLCDLLGVLGLLLSLGLGESVLEDLELTLELDDLVLLAFGDFFEFVGLVHLIDYWIGYILFGVVFHFFLYEYFLVDAEGYDKGTGV